VAIEDAVQKMREGAIGDVYLARGLCYKWRDTIGRTPVSPVPAGVDYDLWTGRRPSANSRPTASITTGTVLGHGHGDIGNQGFTRWISRVGAWA